MGRGRRSEEQRNQATSDHQLKKKSRSRMGKGINSLEFAGASIHFAGAKTRRWRPTSRDGGSLPVASERGCGVTAQGCGARRGRVGEWECGRRGQGYMRLSHWAGPYRQSQIRRYLADDVSNIRKNNKKSDTRGYVSAVYRTHDTRCQGRIRVT
jgi:hypothetical protein